jgi:hypothetical protein
LTKKFKNNKGGHGLPDAKGLMAFFIAGKMIQKHAGPVIFKFASI